MLKEKNKNLTATVIGLGLIVMVVGIYFLKSYWENKKNPTTETSINTPDDTSEKNNASSLSIQDLLTKISKKEKMIIIDIRSATDFKQEHLEDSKNIPLEKFKNNFQESDKNAQYILIDANSSADVIDLAGNFLPQKGFTKVFYLDGGFNSWKSNFFPTISDGDPTSIIDQAKVKYIDSDTLKKALDKNPHILIVDVRTKALYDQEHITGSVNIYVDDIEKKSNLFPVTGIPPIVLYDDDTISAFKADVRLFNLGRVNFLILSDNFQTWKSKGYPTEKTQP